MAGKRTIKQQIEFHERMAVYNQKKADESTARAAKFAAKVRAHSEQAKYLRNQVAEAAQ